MTDAITAILAQPAATLKRLQELEQENELLRMEIERLKAELAWHAHYAGDGTYRPESAAQLPPAR